jgi:hypothetical protein
MGNALTVLCTALCGRQEDCEIDKQASIVRAQMGMECKQSNVRLGLVNNFSVNIHVWNQLVRAVVNDESCALPWIRD